MAAPVQEDKNQDNFDETADPAAAEGAASIRLLPALINELRLAYWTTTSEWKLACARLKRYMKKAAIRGAGPSGLPDPRAFTELNQELGQEEPPAGVQPCGVCNAFTRGGCRKQKQLPLCQGCSTRQLCEIWICPTPVCQGPPSAATTGKTEALNVGIEALRRAGANDRAAFQAFIEALVREGFED